MPISHEIQDQHEVIKIEGDFDAYSAEEAKRIFTQVAQSCDKNVVLDCSKVDFIDSSGIGAIVFLYKRLRMAGQDLVLQGLQDQPQELIQLLRLDQIIETR